ncbi:hypothetical protein [Altererythrobacter sp. MF3-039]|uniref:hypothetical protein n=1 Tax=Altererythrobacter sp. MF3-039 TaxID=3252901 RepID=UPI00390C69E3
MRYLVMLALCTVLVACEQEMSVEEQRAAVEASQVPPVIPEEPQAIRYTDIEKYEIYGSSCAFAPEGGGLGALAIAMADAGYMKIDGDIVSFSPDTGSGELPLGARERYTDTHYSFVLTLDQDQGRQAGYETQDFPARLVLRNERDQVVYQAKGLAQCGV